MFLSVMHSKNIIQQFTTQFGKMGKVLYYFARGINGRTVLTEWVRKSEVKHCSFK